MLMVGIHGTHIQIIVQFAPMLVGSHYAGFIVCQQVFSIGLTPLGNIIEGNAERRIIDITLEAVASQSNISVVVMGIAAISPIAYRAFSGSGFLHLRLIIEEGKNFELSGTENICCSLFHMKHRQIQSAGQNEN